MLQVYSPLKWNREQKSACTYYRVEVPAKAMLELGMGEIFIDDGKWDEVEISYPSMFGADIDLFFALAGENIHKVCDAINDLTPGYAADGKTMKYPPSVVVDIDDNIDYVHPFNITYSHFGIRNWDGELLKPGDTLCIDGRDGKSITLWEDKVTEGDRYEVFDIERNQQFVNGFHKLVSRGDGATFPNKYLGEWYEENWGVKDWYIFPNSVVPGDYPQVDLAPHDGVRVFWQGGMSHAPDWHPIKDAVIEVAKKYPQVTWVMWGNAYKPLMDALPKERVEIIPWMHYMSYKPWRVIVDADINLCPLVDNMFNRCKSAIKWYEGSILKRPEVTLAANVVPYSDEMTDGENGLLYSSPKEFAQKLGNLIENETLRRSLAAGAKEWVLENRHYLNTVPGLVDYYHEIRAKKIAKFKKPKLISVGSNANGTYKIRSNDSNS